MTPPSTRTPHMTSPTSTPTPRITHKCKACTNKLNLRLSKIQCDVCLGYFHSKCSLKTRDYELLNGSWICVCCMTDIFPFNSIETNDEFIDVHTDNIFDKLPFVSKKVKCNGCNGEIKKNFPALFCKSCNQPFH